MSECLGNAMPPLNGSDQDLKNSSKININVEGFYTFKDLKDGVTRFNLILIFYLCK
jgi:hypothetical protein